MTMDISPQFHVIHDDQFTSVTGDPSVFTDKFYAASYEKASWIHNDNFADTEDLHFFETNWSNPPTIKKPAHIK
jgi:hypothetical protein